TGDIAVGQLGRDIIGTAGNASLDALAISADANFIYFRQRLNQTPLMTSTTFLTYGWVCQISTDSDNTDYELYVMLSGKSVPDVEVWTNNQPGVNSPSDPADVETHHHDIVFGTNATGGNIGGAFFAEWAVPRTDLGITGTTPLQFVCGTNSNGG